MTETPQILPDAAATNWVDRHAPVALRPWLKLGRFDRPVGIWLLFLPGAMGIVFGAQWVLSWEALYKLVLFAVGSALMRGAGCAFNDFVDRDFDAQVERTRMRPIPAGQITPKQALAFVAASSLISLLILIQLGWTAIALGIASLALVAAYPFMKRITWWPQAWLGLTFNWGFLMGYASLTGHLSLGALIFYAGLVFWTIGYDTIYAYQDIEDDAMIGVKSSARALGSNARGGVSFFYALAIALTGIGGIVGGLYWPFYGGLFITGWHLFAQVRALRIDDNGLLLRLFKSNRDTGLLWVAAIILGHLRP
ncbi:4-hydroxybenzoate octaprenyltransferase [Asticcacaulis sp. BYS171W]|uniref:4-hydroxybenzoate octaprenyltransferase n=1 Tax=Asticcacaulis aquaticus TaxID=2984212 RepID=A0ABT5HTU9_9CAUL|nr:4-hydroxybenzoate octaprenyltransferase [Asticcacaulis aquaticus]MDC7683409.1 4-hydroxybenzoate octaprenyltransferase [Asticcacaulis aquaticus]